MTNFIENIHIYALHYCSIKVWLEQIIIHYYYSRKMNLLISFSYDALLPIPWTSASQWSKRSRSQVMKMWLQHSMEAKKKPVCVQYMQWWDDLKCQTVWARLCLLISGRSFYRRLFSSMEGLVADSRTWSAPAEGLAGCCRAVFLHWHR